MSPWRSSWSSNQGSALVTEGSWPRRASAGSSPRSSALASPRLSKVSTSVLVCDCGPEPCMRATVLFSAMASRFALVTGGAGGIGRAIVAALAAHGHQVASGDIVDDAAGEAALAVSLDVTDSASVEEAVGRAERELGSIEILVNTAGWDEFRPFLKTEEDFWEQIIELNYKGCLRVCR